MKASVPSRKKIKLKWFKTNCKISIEREIDIQYESTNISSNKLSRDTIVRYVLPKEGDLLNKEIPINSPMTLYKNNLPFLFLNTSKSLGTKIISEDMIDDDIIVDDDIVKVKEGKPEVTFEDARDPKEHIEVRTRYDNVTRKITIENKLENAISILVKFKQTKDIVFIKSDPEPSEVEEPIFKFQIIIDPETKKRISLELQAKIITRTTKIKPEFIKRLKS